MKRFLTMAVVGVLALGLSSVAYANYCAFDPVPASTLLFPFVAYDYNGGDGGQTTLFAITNVSSEATIVHITVWSDFSVAVLDFNLTMTGYDVQTINIRDILRDGKLPTDDAATGRFDNIWTEGPWGWTTTDPPAPLPAPEPLPTGPYSPENTLASVTDPPFMGLPDPEATWNGTDGTGAFTPDWYLRCNPDDLDTLIVEGWISSPENYVTPIDDGTLGVFKLYLQSSQTATKAHTTCDYSADVDFDTWFVNRSTDDVTWMYITADVVWACNKDLPDGDADTYFADPVVSTNNGVKISNVLVGDTIWLDRDNNYSEADQAVHIEAQQFGPGTPADDGKRTTFYHRYHADTDVAFQDYREPLPTAWSLRYFDEDTGDVASSALSWVRAWKGTTNQAINPDLYGPNVDDPLVNTVPDPICTSALECLNPTELYANSCQPYTVYIWDEDENVNSLADPGAGDNPWSGGDPGSAGGFEIPNLLALETQEVAASQFYLVDDFGWMMFIWPMSNGSTVDAYQTWMGSRFQAYGTYSAGLTGSVLGNYNCNSSHVLPVLAIGVNSFSE